MSAVTENEGLSEEPMPSRKAAERAPTSEGCGEDWGKTPELRLKKSDRGFQFVRGDTRLNQLT